MSHPGGAVIARVLLALCAVLIVGWLVVLERDYRLQVRTHSAVTPAAVDRSIDDLERSRLLNPDRAPDFQRALFYLGQGDWRRGAALAQDTLRSEPDNLNGWNSLRLITAPHDRALALRAIANLRRLDPIGTRGLTLAPPR
jgi:hypothetical protein